MRSVSTFHSLWSVVMTNIVTVHSRKGGVGKTTLAYELAWLLDAVLVDFDYEAGNATGTWGWKPETRAGSPLLDALEKDRVPKPLTGFRKADLVPGHPLFAVYDGDASSISDALAKWAGEWGRDWVVVDTHNGFSEATAGALQAANLVLAPVPLATKDLLATRALVDDLVDYPLVLIPSIVRSAPQQMTRKLREIVAGTPVQVGPFVPFRRTVGQRTKRIAISAEEPPSKDLQPVKEAMGNVADYVRRYLDA